MDAEQGVLSEVVGWISGLHLSFIYMTVAIAIIMTYPIQNQGHLGKCTSNNRY